jgi:hypothetical protein
VTRPISSIIHLCVKSRIMKGYIDSIFNNTPYTFQMTGCARLRPARSLTDSNIAIDLTGGEGMPRRCKGDITPGRHHCSGVDLPAYSQQPLLQGKAQLHRTMCENSVLLQFENARSCIALMRSIDHRATGEAHHSTDSWHICRGGAAPSLPACQWRLQSCDCTRCNKWQNTGTTACT